MIWTAFYIADRKELLRVEQNGRLSHRKEGKERELLAKEKNCPRQGHLYLEGILGSLIMP